MYSYEAVVFLTSGLMESLHNSCIVKGRKCCTYVAVLTYISALVCSYIQKKLLELDTLPTTIPNQDTKEHTVLDNLHQQPLLNNSGGQMLQSVQLNQLALETKVIVCFNVELSADLYQHLSDLPEDTLPPSMVPLVCNHSNTQ